MSALQNLETAKEVEDFINQWPGEEEPIRNWFSLLFAELQQLKDVSLQFVARPGVSYSLRPKHRNQQDRDLFAMVDVVDDEPESRWLSVCFYGDMITDPKELGELIPGGLAGADGYCFDMFNDDSAMASYLIDRLREAAQAASA